MTAAQQRVASRARSTDKANDLGNGPDVEAPTERQAVRPRTRSPPSPHPAGQRRAQRYFPARGTARSRPRRLRHLPGAGRPSSALSDRSAPPPVTEPRQAPRGTLGPPQLWFGPAEHSAQGGVGGLGWQAGVEVALAGTGEVVRAVVVVVDAVDTMTPLPFLIARATAAELKLSVRL